MMKIAYFLGVIAFMTVDAKILDDGDFMETVFVFEMARHGARSHYMNNPDIDADFFG